jgi:hypothetical protein
MVTLTVLEAPKWYHEVVTHFWRSTVLCLLCQVDGDTFPAGAGKGTLISLGYLIYTYHWICTPVPKIGLHTDCDSWSLLLISYILHTGEVTHLVLGPHTHQIVLPLAVLDWWSGSFELCNISCHGSWLLAICHLGSTVGWNKYIGPLAIE